MERWTSDQLNTFTTNLSSLLGVIAEYNSNHAQKWGQICCNSVQLVRGSSFRIDLLQNPYFKNAVGGPVGSTVSLGVGVGPDFPIGWEVNFDKCYASEIGRISFSDLYKTVWDAIPSKKFVKFLTILTKLTHKSSDIWPFCHEINRRNMNINWRMRLSFYF